MRVERRVRLALNQVQYYVEERILENKKCNGWKIEKVFYNEDTAEKYMKGRK